VVNTLNQDRRQSHQITGNININQHDALEVINNRRVSIRALEYIENFGDHILSEEASSVAS